MHENRGLKIFLSTLSIFLSLGLGAYFFYLGLLKIYWFFPFVAYFLFDALFTLIGVNRVNRYSGMRVFGVWQVISVIFVMIYLLAMILWDDPNRVMPYQMTFIILGSVAGIRFISSIMAAVSMKRRYQPILHALRNANIIQIIFLMIIAGLTVTNYYFPGTGEGLLKEKPLWIYIIDVAANVVLTFIVSVFALSTDIRAKVREQISTAGKIRHLLTYIHDIELSMFFSLIFTGYLVGLALMNTRTSIFYAFLAGYYVLIMSIRIINYIWHKIILWASRGNKFRENRHSSFILLFNAFAYSFFSDIIAVGAIILMANKANVGANIYLFLFFIIPFGILKFVLAIKAIHKNKKENDTYRLGLGYISLIGALFSGLEIVAISTYGLKSIFKWVATISSVIVVKIFVLVISIIFIVHFIRSLVINRRSQEKKLSHENQTTQNQ